MKTKKRTILATLMTLVMIIGSLVIAPVSSNSAEAASKLKVTAAKTVAVNCTMTIKTNVKAKFRSSNKKIATVSSKGVVKGKKAGKVTITVTSKSNKKQKKVIKITVKNQLVITSPKNATATLNVGESLKISTNISANFKTSNANIVEVNKSGKAVAKSAGTTKVTVTAKSNKKLKKTVTLTVVDNNQTTEKNTTQDIAPKPAPTTETPTVEQPTTERPTTEQPTTEQPTTEQPTTEEPTPVEKPYLTAEYPGGIVARNYFFMDDDGSFYIDKYCLNIYLVNGNEKTQICPSFVSDSDYTSETIDNVTYYSCTLSYKNYSGKYTFQVTDENIDIDIIILNVYTSREIYSNLTAGTLPALSQLDFYLGYKNGDAKKIDVDNTTCTILADKVYSDGTQSVFVRYDYKYNYNGTTIIIPFYDWVSPIDN